ncbi:MAG: hypothetical protein ACJ741_22070 [Pyrinomonadaceae bacterium]
MHACFLSSAARRLPIIVAFVSVLWLAAPPTVTREQSRMERDAELRKSDEDREMEMKRFELMKNARPDGPAAARLAVKQIGEDFRQLQIVNNEMMRATFSSAAPRAIDYDHISKATAEINRRASRLRTNLQFPAVEREAAERDAARAAEREIADEREMRASLLSLDELIMGFVNNPTFAAQAVLDAQQSARADHDLAFIIKLSQKIKQRAEKLK